MTTDQSEASGATGGGSEASDDASSASDATNEATAASDATSEPTAVSGTADAGSSRGGASETDSEESSMQEDSEESSVPEAVERAREMARERAQRGPEVEMPLLRRGAFAVAFGVLAAVLVRLVAVLTVPNVEAFGPLGIGPMVSAAGIGALLGTAVYALVLRLADDPDRTFTMLAGVVLLLSLVPVVTVAPGIAGATTLGLVLLGVAHVAVAAGIVAGVTGRVGPFEG
jgi:hypothetical protein